MKDLAGTTGRLAAGTLVAELKSKFTITDQTLQVTSTNAVNFRWQSSVQSSGFAGVEAVLDCGHLGQVRQAHDGSVGVKELTAAFLGSLASSATSSNGGGGGGGTNSKRPAAVNAAWVKNHFKWIVWKLASMERRLPEYCAGKHTMLTLVSVLRQLRHRHWREVERAERSCLKKIIEKDAHSARFVILMVAEIVVDAGGISGGGMYLVLSDGWYPIRAKVDGPLRALIASNKINVGHKLCICGAELNSQGPTPPLEAPASTYLTLSYNGTRRARWYGWDAY